MLAFMPPPSPLVPASRHDVVAGTSEACVTCLFYVEPTAVVRAMPMINDAVRKYRNVPALQLHIWPHDVLRRTELAARALSCADTARVVALVVAAHDDDISEALRQWFERWEANTHGIKDRLLLLLSPADRPMPQAFDFLSDCATRTGVGLIWRELPDGLWDLASHPWTHFDIYGHQSAP